MDAIEVVQRRILREKLLEALFEAAKGATSSRVDLGQVGAQQKIPREDVNAAWRYFQEQRWVRTAGAGLIVSLTAAGADRVEELVLARQKDGRAVVEPVTTPTAPSDKPLSCDIAVVCALHETELDSILDTGQQPWRQFHVPDDPTTYHETFFIRDKAEPLRVVAAAAPQMGMTASGVLAAKMILHFDPKLVAMVGIAAGADDKKQGIGDILAPDTTFDYGSGKLVPEGDGLKLQPDPKPLAIEARLSARLQDWKRQRRHVDAIRQSWRADPPKSSLDIHVGPLGSGSAVLDSRKPLADVVEHWRKLIGIEMEAHGVHLACQNARTPKPWFLCIKSICDFATNKSDSWQKYAAFVASQFFYKFVTEEWASFAFLPTSRAHQAANSVEPQQLESGIVQEIAHLKEQLALQKEQLAFQTGSIREILASITAGSAKADAVSAVVDPKVGSVYDLSVLEGVWVDRESDSTFCIRMVQGKLRCPYSYGSDDKLTGEYYSFRIENGALFGRYRWFNNPIAGYFYLRIESRDRLVGGWWSASEPTAEATNQVPPVDGMVSSIWMRQKDVQRFPEWAEVFFRSIPSTRALDKEADRPETGVDEGVDLEHLAQEVVDSFAMRLVDKDDIITGLIAETNASGYYLDQLDILSAGPLELDVPRIPFRAYAHFSGDQEPDHIACGDAIIAEISGTLEFDGIRWRVADDYSLDAKLDDYGDVAPDTEDP